MISEEKLLEKIYSELNEVIEEITQLELHDELIPSLSGWELALKWVITQVNELKEVSA